MRNLALITYFYLFIFGCVGSLLLPGFFSSWSEQRLLSGCGAWVSHCSVFSCCWAWALGCLNSVVVAHRLSCPAACGILLDQGSNLCLLLWQADSLPSEPPGKPFVAYHWPFHAYWGFFSVLERTYCVEVIFCVHLIQILCVPGPRYPCWPKLTMEDGFFKQATLVTEHIFLLRFFFLMWTI